MNKIFIKVLIYLSSMGPKPKNEQAKEDENYIPELLDTSTMDASELIQQITKIKQMIKLEAEANEEAFNYLETTKKLYELDREHWRQLRTKRQEFQAKCEKRKFRNESELRDREGKINNITYERMSYIGSLWHRHYQQSQIKHFNRQKTDLMEISDLTKGMNKLIEFHSLHEDAAHYKLSRRIEHSGNEVSLGMYNQHNKQIFCMLAKNDEYVGFDGKGLQIQIPNSIEEEEEMRKDTEFQKMKKELMEKEIEKLKSETSLFNGLIKENDDILNFFKEKAKQYFPSAYYDKTYREITCQTNRSKVETFK